VGARARVIGLGQAAAGDDGVGLAVLEEIRRVGAPPGTEIVEAWEATGLIALLETPDRVIVVDAVVGHFRVGEVLELRGEALPWRRDEPGERGRWRPLSSHGVSLEQAIALARVLTPGGATSDITFVGVAIPPPARYTTGLSPAVRAAVPVAARTVLARIGG
jgi:hydrogenase maturation protease